MSGKSHRTDFVILGTLGFVTVAIVVAVVGWGLFQDDRSARAWFRTSHSRNVEGTVVCYTLFDRLGYSVRRSEKPLLAGTLDETDVLFMISPLLPTHEGETGALDLWILGGGVLVCTPGVGPGAPHYAAADAFMRSRSAERVEDSRTTTAVPETASALPLARDVSRVHLKTSTVIDTEGDEALQGADPLDPLLTDTAGVRIAARRIGAGRVIIMADSSFLANGWIDKEDNAIVAVNLLAHSVSLARGGRVVFDEYHFGYGRQETRWAVLRAMLFHTSPGWAVLCLTLAGVLFLIYRGRRLGTRRAPGRPRRRSKLEYVHAVGATYRAAGAHGLAFGLIFRWFRRRCAERAGLPASASSNEIAMALARRTGKPQGRYELLFRECEDASVTPRLSGRRGSTLFKRLAAVESEIFNGNPARK